MSQGSALDTITVMDCYEAMAAASKAMLVAARNSDWDAVASLERRCAGIIGALHRSTPPALDELQRKRRLEIIRALLAEDAEIRHLAQPWLTQLQSLFVAGVRPAS